MQKDVTFVKKNTLKKISQSLNYWKVRGHCHC